MALNASHFSLAVLNPGGRDPDQDFADFAGLPDAPLHAPVNYHGYAAACGGAFLRSIQAVQTRGIRNVILLLRSDLKAAQAALLKLQAPSCRVFLSFKESGLHQVSQTLLKSGNPAVFADLCRLAAGAISSTPDLLGFYRDAGCQRVAFIPTPYPLEDARWDFALPPAERKGIFVGTREFEVPTRHHALALASALALGTECAQPVTVVNEAGRTGRKHIENLAKLSPGTDLTVIEGRRSYPDYLRNLARHRLVWQCDASAVPGQVAGDALLCGLPCVGGNGATERLAFPDFTSHGRTLAEGRETAKKLLLDPSFYLQQGAAAKERARQKIGFLIVRQQLAELFASA